MQVTNQEPCSQLDIAEDKPVVEAGMAAAEGSPVEDNLVEGIPT